MRIALDEIDPHIADMVAVMAPVHTKSIPAPRRQQVRLSRRRHLALATAIVVPPLIGFMLACMVAPNTHEWVPWATWFGTWATGTLLGCRATLRGRLASRRAAVLTTFNALASPALGLGVAMSVFRSGPNFGFGVLWLMISLAAALTLNRIALNVATQAAVTSTLQPDTMRDVFAALSLTRAERVYCDVLLFLARARPNADTEQFMRETLHQLNDLMQSSRQLEEQRLSLLPLLGSNVVSELRAEYDRLQTRLNATTDTITRASLEQSLRMLQARIADAHNLQTGMERLNTQQEAITQTLSSALSALGRLQIAPDTRADFAMTDIAQSVTQMNQQTIAVESAVEEVLTLRSSH